MLVFEDGRDSAATPHARTGNNPSSPPPEERDEGEDTPPTDPRGAAPPATTLTVSRHEGPRDDGTKTGSIFTPKLQEATPSLRLPPGPRQPTS